MKIEFTPEDFDEGAAMADLSLKIEQVDFDFVDKITDEMKMHQPFLLSAMIGFKDDVTQEEHWEIMKLYFLFWEYFRSIKKVQMRQVTQRMFEETEKTVLEMLIYCEGENSVEAKNELYSGDLQRIKSKALWAVILSRFNNNPVLEKMDTKIQGVVLIGIRSFIECFEAL